MTSTIAFPPPPDDVRHRVAAEMIRAWRAARDLRDEAAELALADPSLELWVELAGLLTNEAERSLLATILVAAGDVDRDGIEGAVYEAHPTRAVEHEGRVYLAVSDPDLEPGDDDDGDQVVRLVVIEASTIAHVAGPTRAEGAA